MPESKVRLCTVEGCDRKHKGRGFCELHRARDRIGIPLDAPIKALRRRPAELRSRTSNGAVEIGVTLQVDLATKLSDEAGTAYGAQARLVRQAIVFYLENRDILFWKRKYQEERTQRLALQQRVDAARASLS